MKRRGRMSQYTNEPKVLLRVTLALLFVYFPTLIFPARSNGAYKINGTSTQLNVMKPNTLTTVMIF